VQAGKDIDGGVYYVESGDVSLRAGGSVKTNATRAAFTTGLTTNPVTWLPTTFFVGKGNVDVVAGGDVEFGPVVNPFWLPQSANNRFYETAYFSTYDSTDSVSVSSLGGQVTVQGRPDTSSAGSIGSAAWILACTRTNSPLTPKPPRRLSHGCELRWRRVVRDHSVSSLSYRCGNDAGHAAGHGFQRRYQPGRQLDHDSRARRDSRSVAAGDVNGVEVNGVSGKYSVWGSAAINLSDADPAALPSIDNPISSLIYSKLTSATLLDSVNALFAESGRTNFSLDEKLQLHGLVRDSKGQLAPCIQGSGPVHLYAAGGNLRV